MAQAPVSFQRPIVSEIKTKKILTNWVEPENPIRYAFAKLLRERDKTKRIYEVNPYVEVYTLREKLYGLYCESLDAHGDSWIFVIDGPEKAMVIDTAWGLGDLKGLIRELIGEKPYFVVNTHCHGDHALGNYQFDRVYCHEFEVYGLQQAMNPHVWDKLFDENGKNKWTEFPREDLIPFREYEIIGVPDGYIFDLGGGHQVELVFLPGHSVGHCGFLDKKNRIFFPGDDCCVGAIGIGARPGFPHGEYGTVEALYKEFQKITARIDEFDSLFPSHGPVETGPVMLFSAMEACKAVLDDPENFDMESDSGHGLQRFKMIYESGYLRYTADTVYMSQRKEG